MCRQLLRNMAVNHQLSCLAFAAILLPSATWGNGALPLPLRLSTPQESQAPFRSSASVARAGAERISVVDSLVLLTQITQTALQAMALGDTDHDGKNEAVVDWRDESFVFSYRILENQGNNVYTQEYSGADILPYAIGDLDQDGRSEIIGQYAGQIKVYESLDSTSYPTQLVWASPTLANVVGFTTIGDTDHDGRMEIIHSINTFSSTRLCIYENTGDNTYDQVYLSLRIAEPVGPKVVADLDGDGHTEIAFSGLEGWVHLFESTGDNTWVETWTDSTGFTPAYGAAGGRDTDGDGKPELFIMGDTPQHGDTGTIVYESSGDNQFNRVASINVHSGTVGGDWNAVGDLDGHGLEEYLMVVGAQPVHLLVYRSTGANQWTLALDEPATTEQNSAVYPFDSNRNGRDELFWTSDDSSVPTFVLEYPPRSPSDVVPHEFSRSLTLAPNPCRSEARLRLSGSLAGASRLAVFTVDGRLVSRRPLVYDQEGGVQWIAAGMRPGIYFLQLENPTGASLARGRAVVVR